MLIQTGIRTLLDGYLLHPSIEIDHAVDDDHLVQVLSGRLRGQLEVLLDDRERQDQALSAALLVIRGDVHPGKRVPVHRELENPLRVVVGLLFAHVQVDGVHLSVLEDPVRRQTTAAILG